MGHGTQLEIGYIDLSRKLLQEALKHNLAINAPFPSFKKLAERHLASERTVELAFDELINKGYCYSILDKGMHLKKAPLDTSRDCLTYGLVLGHPKTYEKSHPFFKNIYLSLEEKIIERSNNLLCLHEWNQKSALVKKKELAQFTSNISGYIGIGLFHEKDCILLRDSGISSVIIDMDTDAINLDCVVFDNESIMNKLMNEVLSEMPEAVYYVDFKRTINIDPAIEERRCAFLKKYSKFIGEKKCRTDMTLTSPDKKMKSISSLNLEELTPLLDHIKNAIGRIHLVCADDLVAVNACFILDSIGCIPGKDFSLAYIGPEKPRGKLLTIPANIGVIDEQALSETGYNLLIDRVKKGSGPVIKRKLPGSTIKWRPSENNS